MRLAFEIKNITAQTCLLAIYDGKGLRAGAEPVLMSWLRPAADSKLWDHKPSFHLSGLDGEGASMARLLCSRVEKYCEAQKWPRLDNPLTVAHVILAHGGSQTVWDKRLGKFRTVGLMKDGVNKFELIGLDQYLEVEADDEEEAKRRGKKVVAELMSEEPERAEALAKWFVGGCKVKKSVDAKMPDIFSVSQLAANNSQEVARAGQPVARRHGKGNGEE